MTLRTRAGSSLSTPLTMVERQTTRSTSPRATGMATRRAGDFFRLQSASKASKLADLTRVNAVEKTLLLCLTPVAMEEALKGLKVHILEQGPR